MLKPEETKLVLFVCTGNSCRSVIAQHLFEKMLEEEGLSERIKVASAGTTVPWRIKPIHGTIRVLGEEGINARYYRAQKLSPVLIKQADLIIVMEKRHRLELLDKYPEFTPKIFLVNQFLPQENFLDLPDPIGKPLSFYQETKERIKEALPGILKKVKEL